MKRSALLRTLVRVLGLWLINGIAVAGLARIIPYGPVGASPSSALTRLKVSRSVYRSRSRGRRSPSRKRRRRTAETWPAS
jgi:hypothetical protein